MKQLFYSKVKGFFIGKKNLTIITLIFSSTVFYSQVSVTATNTTNPVSYSRLKLAFDAINSGTHTGIINISISGNVTETESAILNQSGTNSSSYSAVRIFPSGGSVRTISGSFTGHLIDLNGADNVFIDGLNTNGNSLTISSSGTGVSSAIRFINDASSNQIANTTITGAATTDCGAIFFSSGLTTGNDLNTITTCTVTRTSTSLINGIYSLGSTSATNDNNKILLSNIFNFFDANSATAGIDIAAGNSDWTITDNRLYQSATVTFTTANTHSAINVSSGNNHDVSYNTIGFSNSSGTGTYSINGAVGSRFVGISLSVETTTASTVDGNVIAGINVNTTSGALTQNGVLCGINIVSGNVNVGTVNSNIIGSTAGVSSLVVTSSTSNATIVGIHVGSSGSINISNNKLGGFTFQNTSNGSIGGGIIGINVSAAVSNLIINDNIIGNSTANNMQSGTLAFTTNDTLVSGIFLNNNALGTSTINNNRIQNLVSYGVGTTGFARGIYTAGTTANGSKITITNNIIENIRSYANNVALTNGRTTTSGVTLSMGNNCVVSNNTISSIIASNASGGTCSAAITVGNTTAPLVSKNRIFNIINESTATSVTQPPTAVGVLIRSGAATVNIINNMISLGVGQTANTVFLGIWAQHGSTPDPVDNIFFNSVSISGTASSGSQSSFAFARADFAGTARTAPVSIKNNIFSNTRSGGTGKHYAIANNFGATPTNTGWDFAACNFNVLNAAAATIGFWGSDQTFAGWKTIAASDNNSKSNITVNWTSLSTANLRIVSPFPSAIDGIGTNIPSVIDDFEGDIRADLSPTDIGADAGNFILSPIITFTPLTNTCNAGLRTLTVNISDPNGVPTSGVGLPVLYWKINSSSIQQFDTATFLGGNQYQFTFGLGTIPGDVVSYYIVAQDNLGNVGSTPSNGFLGLTTNPPAVNPQPSQFFSYKFLPTMSGNFTVGQGQTYTTITQAVNEYNNSCLSGPVVFTLTNATYPSETFPIVINANPFASATNTLLIKPQNGVSSTIVGAATTAIFIIKSGKYITIDGSNGNTVNDFCTNTTASRNLTITNTSTNTSAAVISIQDDAGIAASYNQIINCNIVGNSNSITRFGVNISGLNIGSGALSIGNNFNKIINNRITRVQTGIFVSSSSQAQKTIGGTIQQNIMDGNVANGDNLGQFGIMVLNADSYTIHGNVIKSISTSTTTDIGGIILGTNGLSTSMAVGAETSNTTVSNNIVDNILNSGTFSASGIAVGITNSGTNTITNNMVSNIYSSGTAGDFGSGILVGGGTGTTNIFHNSVTMNATTALSGGDLPNVALAILGANPVVSSRNNILIANGPGNGATIRNVSIGLNYALPASNFSSNSNILFASGSGSNIGLTGAISNLGSTHPLLNNWQNNTSQDLTSRKFLPGFINTNNLRIDNTASNQILNFAGSPTSITTDIDCQVRNTSTPFIGADEIQISITAPALQNQLTCKPVTIAELLEGNPNYRWYSTPTGGSNLSLSTIVSSTTTFYVSQIGNFGMESGRTPLTVSVDNATTWDGSNWSNGTPNGSTKAIFEGNFTATTNLTACSVSVSGTAVVTIPAGFNLTVNNEVTVAASATLNLENNANLIQINAATNTGNIVMKRDTSINRLDYTYWSSPVAGQNLLNFTPQTLPNRFYTYSEPTKLFVQVSSPSTTNFDTAKGYSLRAPNNFLDFPAAAQTFTGTYTGVPNNGNFTIPVTFTAGQGIGYNLIGNPYPSTVSGIAFLTANTGSIYFWTHKVLNAGVSNYATMSLGGETAATAGGVGALPNRFIQVGQGFMFLTTTSKNVNFTNAMRQANNANQFFRTATTAQNDKIWLNLTNNNGLFSQTLVGYLPNTTTAFDDGFDAPQLNGNGLSSMISNNKYAIQSRGNFDNTDVVKLNLNLDTAGNYTISKDNTEGIFSSTQDFFLKDNLVGIIHNIKQTDYNFVATAGEITNRFEIIYQSVLSNNENIFENGNVIVFEQNGMLHISATDDLKNVKVFDIQGRNIFEAKNINSKSTVLTSFRPQQQVLMVQITNSKDEVVSKKVVF
jgi:hypothetical protein